MLKQSHWFEREFKIMWNISQSHFIFLLQNSKKKLWQFQFKFPFLKLFQQCREDECNFINPEREFEICGVFPSNDTETSGNSTIIELYGALRSPIQVNSEVGTCASIVDEFAFIVSENTISSSPAYEYTLEICKNAVVSCFYFLEFVWETQKFARIKVNYFRIVIIPLEMKPLKKWQSHI